jgi:hypothetical protein
MSIPDMTDDLGRYWQQPNRTEVTIDETHAVMGQDAYDKLMEYSRSKPTGVYPGRMWKAIAQDGTAYLCWYGIVPGNPDVCSTNHRQILICEGSK